MDWKIIMDMETKDGETFLAAVEVKHSKTGETRWDYALMFWDEGRLHFCDEADTGWSADDYTHWAAIAPPVNSPSQ